MTFRACPHTPSRTMSLQATWRGAAHAGLTAALLLCSPSASHGADPLGDCRAGTAPEVRLEACSKVIAETTLGPQIRARALRMRGDLRTLAGATGEAITDYTESLRLLPGAVTALTGRARARVSAGDLAGALADYGEAIALSPKSASLLIERGYANLAAGNADAALTDFNEAILINPQSAIAYNNRGLAYRKKGELAKAGADYTFAIGLNPIYAQAYANRGYLEDQRGNKERAVADLRSALELDPSLTGAREALQRLGSLDALTSKSEQRIAQGKTLVEANCSRCHAVGTDGASPNAKAPAFRTLHLRHPLLALREPLTRGIVSPHDEMPRFAVTDADIDNIVAYINSLSR